MTTLYAYNFSDETDTLIHIFQGVYEKHSTNSNKVYPAVIHLGTVNVTQRKFYKAAKFPKKVISQEGTTITLNGYDIRCNELSIVLDGLGYDATMITDITNIVLTAAADKKIKKYELWRHNEYGDMNGLVDF